MDTTKIAPLHDELRAKKAAFDAQTDATTSRIYNEGVAELAAANLTGRAHQVGDKIPDFELNNALNQPVKLTDLLANGPVVLTWYRGGWCPYCNIQLRHLQQSLPELQAAGATLVALTPELPDSSLTTTEKNHLEFPVLTDYNNDLARRLGLVFTLNDDLAQLYSRFTSLEDYNGVATNELPLAATYVVGTDSVIRYAYLNPDYRERAEPADILAAVKAL